MAFESQPPLLVLATPRHKCFACGTCCTGVYIGVLDEEVERIERAAVVLGVDNPIENGGLRVENGACVFLGEDGLCEIHRKFGGKTKPLRCQEFPFVTVRTDRGVHAGIDPACANAWRTTLNGPEVGIGAYVARDRPLQPSQLAAEKAIIGAASRPGTTTATLLHLLCTGAPGGPALPEGFASRWVERLQAIDLPAITANPRNGPLIRSALAPLVEAVADWDPASPPPWPTLSAEQDAWVVSSTRSMLFLRLASLLPSVQCVAMLTLAGGVACGWTDTTPDKFGPALAAWVRLVRVRVLWQALTPDAETMRWLATGD